MKNRASPRAGARRHLPAPAVVAVAAAAATLMAGPADAQTHVQFCGVFDAGMVHADRGGAAKGNVAIQSGIAAGAGPGVDGAPRPWASGTASAAAG